MKKELLKYICSPITYNPLELNIGKVDGEEIIEGSLVDKETNDEFYIIKGIPRFVEKNKVFSNYTLSFGHQWTKYNWLREKDLFEFERIIDKPVASFKDKIIFDAGCGGGRIARFLSPISKLYIGVDYSIACEKAYELCRNVPQAHFIQADLNFLPFPKNPVFDFIFSHGVLHHTPDTKKSFSNLPVMLKSGGELYIAVFRKAFFIFRWSDNCVRFVLNKLPLKMQEKVCEWMIYLQHLPNPGFWKRFFWFSMQNPSEIAKFCNYDWYAPKHHSEHTVVEVMNWFAEYGFKEITYINAWPYCPIEEKYSIPGFKNSFRLGQLVGVRGIKI